MRAQALFESRLKKEKGCLTTTSNTENRGSERHLKNNMSRKIAQPCRRGIFMDVEEGIGPNGQRPE